MSMDTEYCDRCGFLHDKGEDDDDCPTCELIQKKNKKIDELAKLLYEAKDVVETIERFRWYPFKISSLAKAFIKKLEAKQ